MLLDNSLLAIVILHDLHDHGPLIRAQLVVVQSQLRGEGGRGKESVSASLMGERVVSKGVTIMDGGESQLKGKKKRGVRASFIKGRIRAVKGVSEGRLLVKG